MILDVPYIHFFYLPFSINPAKSHLSAIVFDLTAQNFNHREGTLTGLNWS